MEKELETTFKDDKHKGVMVKFLALCSSFYTRFNISNFSFKTKLKSNATEFLKAGLYNEYAELLVMGYSPTKKQSALWHTHIQECINDANFTVIDNYFKKGVSFDLLKDFYPNARFMVLLKTINSNRPDFFTDKSCTEYSQYPNLFKAIKAHIFSPSFSKEIQNYWREGMKEFIKNCNSTVKHQIVWAQSYKVSDFNNKVILPLELFSQSLSKELDYKFFIKDLQLFEKCKKGIGNSVIYEKKIKREHNISAHSYLLSITDKYQNEFRKNQAQEIEILKEDAKKVFSIDNSKDISKFEEVSSRLRLEDLPLEATVIIHDIKTIYTKVLEASGKTLETENLVIEQLPKVISKYLSIDASFRDNLTNLEKKNAHNLMINSLEIIHEKLSDVFQNINQERLHSLSATNRHMNRL